MNSRGKTGLSALFGPSLVVSIAEAQRKIEGRIAEGHTILETALEKGAGIATIEQVKAWTDYNLELLRRLFSTDVISQEYRESTFPNRVAQSGADLPGIYLEGVSRQIGKLNSILKRLELFDAPPPRTNIVQTDGDSSNQDTERLQFRASASQSKVFVVHGRDSATLHMVSRFIERLGLEAVVLSEQANEGRTIIEKIEKHSDVGFAVVLITGDDCGALSAEVDKLKPRARQNVILELGYFIGRLGRDKVCPIYQAGVELPSDYLGVAFIALDEAGAWKLQLGKELKAAKFAVDMNNAI